MIFELHYSGTGTLNQSRLTRVRRTNHAAALKGIPTVDARIHDEM